MNFRNLAYFIDFIIVIDNTHCYLFIINTNYFMKSMVIIFLIGIMFIINMVV